MRTFAFSLFFWSLHCLQIHANDRPAQGTLAEAASRVPTNHIYFYSIGRNPDAPSSTAVQGPCIFKLKEKRIATINALKTEILCLPRGAEVYWDSGCIGYEQLPIQGPPTTIVEFRYFCATNGIKFTHVVSGF